jgi:hypothetical protein
MGQIIHSASVQAALFVFHPFCFESNMCNMLFLKIFFGCARYVWRRQRFTVRIEDFQVCWRANSGVLVPKVAKLWFGSMSWTDHRNIRWTGRLAC